MWYRQKRDGLRIDGLGQVTLCVYQILILEELHI